MQETSLYRNPCSWGFYYLNLTELRLQYPEAKEWELREIEALLQSKGGDTVNARVLLVDIETSPNLGYVWGKWEQDVIDFHQEWFMLCFAYKWLGEKRTRSVALPDFNGYKKDKMNDKKLLFCLRAILDKADFVIAHNGDKFDFTKINTRLVFHGFTPPAPFQTVDTCKVARAKFGFNSNKLDDIGRYLNLGRKIHHIGFPMWLGCMSGDEASWKMMRKYNEKDVDLLELVYMKLRPWMTNHPNFNVITGELDACPRCRFPKLMKRGFSITKTGVKQRYQCCDPKCGAYSHGKSSSIRNIIR